MTEAQTSEAQPSEITTEPVFSVAEVEQFSNDDVTAGRAIGKMLSIMFLYTVLAMSLVTCWTFHNVATNHGADSGTAEAAGEPAAH